MDIRSDFQALSMSFARGGPKQLFHVSPATILLNFAGRRCRIVALSRPAVLS